MADIDLVYDSDCPNAEGARIHLMQALEEAGMPAHWRGWVRTAPETPQHLRRFGSPTILVNGKDVAGALPLEGAGACRIYRTAGGGLAGVPPIAMIVEALPLKAGRHRTTPARGSWLRSLAAVPGMLAGFHPAAACPACWPVYAGVLSAAGLGFLWEGPYLLLLTFGLLGATVGILAYGARRYRRYGPLLLGGAASVGLLLSKFLFDSPLAAYAATGLILAASVWNAWPRRFPVASCASCKPVERAGLSTFFSKGGLR